MCVARVCARVWSRRLSAADWRARRPRSAQLAAASAANGGRSRDAAPARSCLQIIIIVPCLAGGAASTATRYVLRTAVAAFGGIRFGIRPSFDLFSGFRVVLSIGEFAPVMLATFSLKSFPLMVNGS